MSDRSDLSSLRERLGKVRRPDRDLDRDLHAAFGLPPKLVLYESPLFNTYTGSIDAALKLLGRLLPMHSYRLSVSADGGDPVAVLFAPPEAPDASTTDGRSWSRQTGMTGPTLPIAILLALIEVLIAQETSHVG